MMRKVAGVLVLVALMAGAWWFIEKRVAEKEPMKPASEQMANPAAPEAPASPAQAREQAPLGPAPAAGPAEGEKAGEKAAELPKEPGPPFRIYFDAAVPPELQKPVPVGLMVVPSPESWPAWVEGDCTLEMLLRLPLGVNLESADWKPKEIPEEEKDDPTGPWKLYEKSVQVQLKAGTPPEKLHTEALQLAVVEEGINWIITTRVRLMKGKEGWQTFGTLFATLYGEMAEFHIVPHAPTDTLRAKAAEEENAKKN